MSMRWCGNTEKHVAHRWPLGVNDFIGERPSAVRLAQFYCNAVVPSDLTPVAASTPASTTEPALSEELAPITGDPTPGVTEVYAPSQWRHKPLDFSVTYYLSGPITGYPQDNHPAFAMAKGILESIGLKVVSPHELPVPRKKKDYELWQHMMLACQRLLDDAGAIVMLKGWPQSRGARAELNMAMGRQLPVYYLDDDLILHNMNMEQI